MRFVTIRSILSDVLISLFDRFFLTVSATIF